MLQLSYVLVYCVLLAPYNAYAQSESELLKLGPCPKLPHPLPKPSFKEKISFVGVFTDIKSIPPGSGVNTTVCERKDFQNSKDLTLIGTDNKTYYLLYSCIEINFLLGRTHFEAATAFVVPKGPDPGTDKRFREALDKNRLSLKYWVNLCNV
ncbi:uncharacterized protein LOC115632992 [Scaptodrosophila lebanonensis]|uniref:Uncharacterized protein LOC115632992 n=1 Tax=Drosophila lebanonensis TaxID=7225 RepID=A0A6J2UCS7_DROLE|nr:uncharacterized protein LOC115632992 [Scaptodrosophila lebanonensis]